jgi:perosamine synthetase
MSGSRAAIDVPLAQPSITDREVELVTQVLRSDSLSMGRFTIEFERRLAALSGRAHAVACSSGTAALHLAVRGLGIGDGDEVITTAFSFVASANCLLYERAVPTFIDIEEETLGIDPALVDAAATARTRGILPVDVYGQPCQIDVLERIASDRGWVLIEDSCEALGSTLDGRPIGSFGDASAFAFYPNKQITTGEGGMVVTDDGDLADAMRSMRNQGRDADGTWLRHVRLGFNYRIDELSAALGVAQLERLDELRAGRTRVAQLYAAALGRHDWLRLPTERPGASVDWFVYVVRLDPTIDRDRVLDALAAAGIPSRPYFTPIHLQPYYRDRFGFRPGDLPVTERVAGSTLALPFSSRLEPEQVERVADALTAAVVSPGRTA